MAFPTSDLSHENILRDIHDPVTQTIRTTATAIIAPGLQVDISHTEDSVRLGDGTNFLTSTQVMGKNGLDVNIIDSEFTITDGTDALEINPDGSLNVNIISGSALTTSNIFNEVTSVASNVLTTIATYVAVANTKLLKVDVGGTNIAYYEVVIDGNVEAKKYTFYQSLNEVFDFKDGLPVTLGGSIIVRVLHNRPDLGDFNANILVEN